MKCPYCGYDKIQPNFNFCPKCKHSLKDQSEVKNSTPSDSRDSEEKGFLNRALSRWTYERAAADPYSYALWAYRNPNDNRVFLGRWHAEGHDLTAIHHAISEANRARQENPTADSVDVEGNIIDSNRQNARREANNNFVDTVNAAYTADAAAIVRNKAIWKLQAGELARHIAPDEWVYVTEHLGGVVIEEGTSAIIYVDGQEVAQMGSGMYVFDDKRQDAEIEANKRKLEPQVERGFFGRIVDGILRFFSGHRNDEDAQQREARRRRVEQIMGRLRKDTIIDIYLKSDRIFPAVFGKQYLADSPEGYAPYEIQSRYLDLKVGVAMQMQISDFKSFITNYMPGKKTVSIADVVKSADNAVYSVLRFRLRDIEVSERGLDEATFNAIKMHLMQNVPNLLHGVKVIDVLDITTDNEKLRRFREVEGQLYSSEREYDFLLRTNEFRNRIAAEENDQKIREARSEQELRFRLDELNKDNLLHDDELEQFVDLLNNQKIIREASNQSDLDQALWGIEHNRLVSKEEFDIFKHDLDKRDFDRAQVWEQFRARSLQATALQKLKLDTELDVAHIHAVDEVDDAKWETVRKQKGRDAEKWDLDAAIYGRRYVLEKQQLLDNIEQDRITAQGNLDVNKIELENARQLDDYSDLRWEKEHAQDEKAKEDAYQRELRRKEDDLRHIQQQLDMSMSATERGSRIALENMRAMKEMELAQLREQHAHEQSMANIDADVRKTEIEAESHMNADQLVGKNVTRMDAAAQAKFAESFSHMNEIELMKQNAAEREKLYQEMVQMAKENGINTAELQAHNADKQLDIMQQMMAAFTQMNMSQNMGQHGVVNSMVSVMRDVANGKIKDAKDLKEEYRTQMQHEQERVDENQQQSLNYTTRVKVSENAPYMGGGTSVRVNVGTRTCPSCGEPINDPDSLCCPNCGRDLK